MNKFSLTRESLGILVNIGRCGVCMRKSLGAAIIAWTFYFGVIWLQLNPLAEIVAGLFAAALTLLWLLHLAVYAARSFGRVFGASGLNNASTKLGRRNAVRVFARAISAAVLISTPVVLFSSRALAFCGQCTRNADCGTCRCVNTAPVNSGKVCNECKCP